MFGYTTFNFDIEHYKYKIQGILYCSNTLFCDLFMYLYYAFNFGLAYDLIATIHSPFESIEQRQKWIILLSPTIFLMLFPYWAIHSIFQMKTIGEKDPMCGSYKFNLMTRPGEATVQIVYFIYVFYACFFAALGILRKGLNKQIKMVILKRYIRYQIILNITYWPFYYQFIYQYFTREFMEDFRRFDPQDSHAQDLKYYHFLFWQRWENFYLNQYADIIYSSRGFLIFLHHFTCPMFR